VFLVYQEKKKIYPVDSKKYYGYLKKSVKIRNIRVIRVQEEKSLINRENP
jgi:hypothetical protein